MKKTRREVSPSRTSRDDIGPISERFILLVFLSSVLKLGERTSALNFLQGRVLQQSSHNDSIGSRGLDSTRGRRPWPWSAPV